MDGDGLAELAVGHPSSNVLSVFEVTAGGVFADPIQFTGLASVRGVTLTDIDGDADPELLAAEPPPRATSSRSQGRARDGLLRPGRDPRSRRRSRPGRLHAAGERRQPGGRVIVPSDEGGALSVFDLNDYHLALTAGALDTVEVGKISTAVQKVTFTNDGFGTVTPTSIVLTGNANDFLVGANGCVGVTLAAGSSCDVDFRFAPTATGIRHRQRLVPRHRPAHRAVDQVLLARTAIAAVAPGTGPAGPAGPAGRHRRDRPDGHDRRGRRRTAPPVRRVRPARTARPAHRAPPARRAHPAATRGSRASRPSASAARSR